MEIVNCDRKVDDWLSMGFIMKFKRVIPIVKGMFLS